MEKTICDVCQKNDGRSVQVFSVKNRFGSSELLTRVAISIQGRDICEQCTLEIIEEIHLSGKPT